MLDKSITSLDKGDRIQINIWGNVYSGTVISGINYTNYQTGADDWYIEMTDDNDGKVRYWKQGIDGGQLIFVAHADTKDPTYGLIADNMSNLCAVSLCCFLYPINDERGHSIINVTVRKDEKHPGTFGIYYDAKVSRRIFNGLENGELKYEQEVEYLRTISRGYIAGWTELKNMRIEGVNDD